MAHHLKVETVPGRNKDGSISKTKKTYRIWDRTRRGKILIAQASSKKDVSDILKTAREMVVRDHLAKHPKDLAFKRKHGIKA